MRATLARTARTVVLSAGASALLGLLGALSACAGAEEGGLTLEDGSKWSNVFGSKEATWHYQVKAPRAFKGRAAWRLTFNGRALSRGEAAVTADPDRPAPLKVTLTAPPVKNGVVLETKLVVSLFDDKGEEAASHQKTVWVFPEDPFYLYTRWLKDLKIRLLDPEKKTANVLEKAGVPFEEVGGVESIAELKDGILVVGEGVSFRDYPALPEALVQAAARGLPVLCLAPSQGTLPVPGAKGRGPLPGSLAWRRGDVITEIDKRLDAGGWSGGEMVASTVALTAEDGMVQGEIAPAGGWPWMEATYPEAHGRLLVCGFGIIARWDAGPTPRFLFERLLERVSGRPAKQQAPESD